MEIFWPRLARFPSSPRDRVLSEPKWLPPDERVDFYRELNRQALLQAERSQGALRCAFVSLAERWEGLANATEDAVRAEIVARHETTIPDRHINRGAKPSYVTDSAHGTLAPARNSG
jgi:hypothetical protein